MGLRVGLAAIGFNRHVLQVISVVEMKNRTVCHGAGEISRKAAIHAYAHAQATEQAGIIKADVVIRIEGMALASDEKVIITIQT